MNKMRKRYFNSWTNNNNYSLFFVQVIAFYMKNALSISDIYLFVILCSILFSSTSRKLFISWIMDDKKKREIKRRIIFWLLPKHVLDNSLWQYCLSFLIFSLNFVGTVLLNELITMARAYGHTKTILI